jgi:hypothetical protein
MITIVEFCHPIAKSGMKNNVLAVLYYLETYEKIPAVTIDKLREYLIQARIKNASRANLADTLGKSAPLVHTVGDKDGKFLWALTDSGKDRVRELLSLPASPPVVEEDVTELELLVRRISDAVVQSFVDEAIKCLRVGALRAAVVFLWAGAIRTIQEAGLARGEKRLNAALQHHDPKARQVRKIDDFAHVREKIVLLATENLGLFDKNQRSTLEDCLDLRNRSGHPSKYSPGPKKVSSFIEDLVGIVFQPS